MDPETRAVIERLATWYRTTLEEEGEDYVYDQIFEPFDQLRRGDLLRIVRYLAEQFPHRPLRREHA